MPGGAEANGLAFDPSSAGHERCERGEQSERERPPHEVVEQEVGDEATRRPLSGHARRNAHAVALHEQQVGAQHGERGEGQHDHVEREEAGERRAGHVLPAAQQREQRLATTGTEPATAVPTEVAKNAISSHGSR